MPIYEYRCPKCGERFEKIRRIADADEEAECPRCRSTQAERVASAFAATGCGTGSRGRFT